MCHGPTTLCLEAKCENWRHARLIQMNLFYEKGKNSATRSVARSIFGKEGYLPEYLFHL